MDIDVYKEISLLLQKAYDKGYKDANERHNKAQEKHYCRECEYWCGESTSIGVMCMNENRRHTGKSRSSAHKYASTPACKSGFTPKKEVNNED